MLRCQKSSCWDQSIARWMFSSVRPSLSIRRRAESRHRFPIFGRLEPLASMRSARCWHSRSASSRRGALSHGRAQSSRSDDVALDLDLLPLTTEPRSKSSEKLSTGPGGAESAPHLVLACGFGSPGVVSGVWITSGWGADSAGCRFCGGADSAPLPVSRGAESAPLTAYLRRPPDPLTDSSPRAARSLSAFCAARSDSLAFRAMSMTVISAFPLSCSSAIASSTISEPFFARDCRHAHSVALAAIQVAHFS